MGHVLLVGQSGFEREALRLLISEAGYGVRAVSADDVLTSCRRGERGTEHIILVDSTVPDLVDLCGELVTTMPAVKVVALVNQDDTCLVRQLGAIGVAGIIDRRRRYAAVMIQLRLVALGEKVAPTIYIEESFTRRVAVDTAANTMTERLSNREMIVAECLSKGMPNKIIARQLGLSEPTVKVHVKAILRKLKVRNRTEAALRVATWGGATAVAA
jgi:two-component system, NarL family, nitrate/nitrite response regulator NarL